MFLVPVVVMRAQKSDEDGEREKGKVSRERKKEKMREKKMRKKTHAIMSRDNNLVCF